MLDPVLIGWLVGWLVQQVQYRLYAEGRTAHLKHIFTSFLPPSTSTVYTDVCAVAHTKCDTTDLGKYIVPPENSSFVQYLHYHNNWQRF